jgi:hypothetical protein
MEKMAYCSLIQKNKSPSSNEKNNKSFVSSVNNLMLMPREETKSVFKILICACKRYIEGQENGILLVNPQLGDNKDIIEPFYETHEFEVYCFCQILIVENKNDNLNNINEIYRKKISITDTDYFLVGGFDLEKREGKIKLYKIIYGNKAWDTKIEFIQDIEFKDDDKLDFDGPISCIIQSKISGHIIVTFYNGKVYLFSPPNLDYYIKNESE